MTMWLRLLKIQDGEGRKIGLFFALALLMQAGSTIGISAADALFLDQLGAERLPLVYLLLPLLMLVVTPLLGYVGRRFGVQRVLVLSMVAIAIGSGAAAGLIAWLGDESSGTQQLVVLLAIKLFASMSFVSLYTWYWNYIDEFFDIQDAKRAYPILTAAMALGSIIGGVGVALLLNVLLVSQLFVVWAALALAVLPLLALINREQRALDVSAEVDNGFLIGLQRMLRTLFTSRYVQAITVVLFLGMFVATVAEYHYLANFTLAVQEPGEGLLDGWIQWLVGDADPQQKLAVLLGVLMAAVNVMNLVLSLFVTNRLTLRLGVRNVALIQPLAYLLVFVFLLMDYGVGAALAGFVAYQGLQYSFDYSNWNLVFNAVPEESKTDVHDVLEGLVEPVGTSLAGVFLLTTVDLENEQQVLLMIGVVMVYLLGSLFLRGQYVKAHLRNLRRQWLDFGHMVTGRGGNRLDEDDQQRLLEHVQDADPKTAMSALRLLALADPDAVVEPLLAWLQRCKVQQHQQATALICQILDCDRPWVVRRLVYGIYDRGIVLDGAVTQELAARGMINPRVGSEFLGSNDVAEHQAGLTALWHGWHPLQIQRALNELCQLLGDDASPQQRHQAVTLIGFFGEARFGLFLADLLSDADETLRQLAMGALARVANTSLRPVSGKVLQAMAGGDEVLRERGLQVLIKLQDPATLPDLLALTGKFSSRSRRMLIQVAQQIGLRAVPALVAVLLDKRLPLEGRTMAARALAEISFPQLQAILDEVVASALEDASRARYHRLLLDDDSDPALRLLARAFAQREQAAALMALDVLGFGGRLPSVDLLRAGLKSPSAKVRANSLEAIEQAVDDNAYQRIVAHLGLGAVPRSLARILAQAQTQAEGEGADYAATREDLLRQLLASDDEVLAALALSYSHQEKAEQVGHSSSLLRIRTLGQPLVDQVIAEDHQALNAPPPLVEVVALMTESPLFCDLSIDQVMHLAASGQWLHATEAQEFCAYQTVVLVVGGAVQDQDGHAIKRGSVLGAESIYGGESVHDLKLQSGAWVLLIHRADIDALLALDSSLAVTLWQRWGNS